MTKEPLFSQAHHYAIAKVFANAEARWRDDEAAMKALGDLKWHIMSTFATDNPAFSRLNFKRQRNDYGIAKKGA